MTSATQNHHDILSYTKDPSLDKWPLMGSPMFPIMIVGIYLYFVLKLGPQMMASRKPFDLKPLLIAYNFTMVIASLVLSIGFFTSGLVTHFITEGCSPKTRGPSAFSYTFSSYSWWYFFTKVVELADTVFFVLRKKDRQVTFLHVYHHSSLVLGTWAYMKYLPGEQGVLIGTVNSIVHVIMYFYYMVAALGPEYQKYIWWKKYMTAIQLGQFVFILLSLATLSLLKCQVSHVLNMLFGANTLVFLCLFSKFYRQTYKKSKTVD
ncbi:very long chain fatty acid elongase 1-like [Periplaneta americana]|uniref:very long chain fatty acid elongase 1-like n=1 Tax=Periplaneta americana TaxID=6978 RepID=UPI0037E71B63